MNETILISAIVGIISSIITAYITTWIKIRHDREKLFQEFKLKYAELKVINNGAANNMATQIAIAVVMIEHENRDKRNKYFIPPISRLTIGRGENNDIILEDLAVSRVHTVISSTKSKVFIEDLSSSNGIFVNNQSVFDKIELTNGDIIKVGQTVLTYKKLE